MEGLGLPFEGCNDRGGGGAYGCRLQLNRPFEASSDLIRVTIACAPISFHPLKW